MNLITSNLLKDLDQLKLERYPLPAHYAMKADSHAREVYAVFLAGVLLSGERISDNQTRLFQMLLASLSLENSQASLYERAKKTDQDLLREFFRIIDEHDLAQSFLVDAVVLCRIEHELTEQQVILFSEIADSLKITIHQMDELMALVAIILGLPSDKAFSADYNYSKSCVWDDYLYKPLTIQGLMDGLTPGPWFLDHAIEVETTWQLNGVRLKFIKEGSITTKTSGVIKIKKSNLNKPKLSFHGQVDLNVFSSTICGRYDEEDKATAITLDEISKASIVKVCFLTENARSMLVKNTSIRIGDCTFERCGNKNVIGGAIAAHGCDEYDFKVLDSNFVNCISRLGLAVRIDVIKKSSFSSSKFKQENLNLKNVDNENFKEYYFDNTSVFSDEVTGDVVINNCEFNGASIRLGQIIHGERSMVGFFGGINVVEIANSIMHDSVTFVNSDFLSKINFHDCKNNIETSDCKSYVYSKDDQEWWSNYE